jgi:hypothetical protein
MELSDLKIHYNSYLAGGIKVFNPVSILASLESGTIQYRWARTGVFWLFCSSIPHHAKGEYPLIRRHVATLDDETLDYFTELLTMKEIGLELSDDVRFNL